MCLGHSIELPINGKMTEVKSFDHFCDIAGASTSQLADVIAREYLDGRISEDTEVDYIYGNEKLMMHLYPKDVEYIMSLGGSLSLYEVLQNGLEELTFNIPLSSCGFFVMNPWDFDVAMECGKVKDDDREYISGLVNKYYYNNGSHFNYRKDLKEKIYKEISEDLGSGGCE